MFYRDRFGEDSSDNYLENILLVGKEFAPGKLKDIAMKRSEELSTFCSPKMSA
jgi:hypothetical protein